MPFTVVLHVDIVARLADARTMTIFTTKYGGLCKTALTGLWLDHPCITAVLTARFVLCWTVCSTP